MEILVKRRYMGEKYTIGTMYLNGQKFCDTLEDTDRKLESGGKKIYGETAIPRGTYKVLMTVSNRMKRLLPILCNVPGYEGVRIHAGNTEQDSLGCILVGENKVKGKVINSRKWESALVEILKNEKDIKITIE